MPGTENLTGDMFFVHESSVKNISPYNLRPGLGKHPTGRRLVKFLVPGLLAVLVIGLSIFGQSETLSIEKIADLVNQDRANHGLPDLDLNPSLNLAAQLKALDMVEKNYFAHISPDGVKPWHWFRVSGYSYTYAGENLAVGFTSAAELEKSWMDSPEHRANILSPHYSDLGLAVVSRNQDLVVVQFFGNKDHKLTLRQ